MAASLRRRSRRGPARARLLRGGQLYEERAARDEPNFDRTVQVLLERGRESRGLGAAVHDSPLLTDTTPLRLNALSLRARRLISAAEVPNVSGHAGADDRTGPSVRPIEPQPQLILPAERRCRHGRHGEHKPGRRRVVPTTPDSPDAGISAGSGIRAGRPSSSAASRPALRRTAAGKCAPLRRLVHPLLRPSAGKKLRQGESTTCSLAPTLCNTTDARRGRGGACRRLVRALAF